MELCKPLSPNLSPEIETFNSAKGYILRKLLGSKYLETPWPRCEYKIFSMRISNTNWIQQSLIIFLPWQTIQSSIQFTWIDLGKTSKPKVKNEIYIQDSSICFAIISPHEVSSTRLHFRSNFISCIYNSTFSL